MARPRLPDYLANLPEHVWSKVKWDEVDEDDHNSCWLLSRPACSIVVGGHYFGTTRAVILQAKLGRPLAPRHRALRTCKPSLCINPDHLYEGRVRGTRVLRDHRGSGFNAFVLKSRNSAQKRGYEHLLTNDQVYFLTKLPCFYCSAVPSQTTSAHCVTPFEEHGGIDRLNNREGYVVHNSLPACGRCNREADPGHLGLFGRQPPEVPDPECPFLRPKVQPTGHRTPARRSSPATSPGRAG